MLLANPLNYPASVLAGGIVLFTGVRLASLPNPVVIPGAVGAAIAASTILKSRRGEILELEPELANQLNAIREMAVEIANQSNDLRSLAAKRLTGSWQMDLLVAIQLSCDRALELPSKIDIFRRHHLQGSDSLISVGQLQAQLAEVRQKLESSSGATKRHLALLEDSLERHLKLAQDGKDIRLAQIFNLSTSVHNSAGVLQQLQNLLQTASWSDSDRQGELQTLNDELNALQENFDLLIGQ